MGSFSHCAGLCTLSLVKIKISVGLLENMAVVPWPPLPPFSLLWKRLGLMALEE